MPCEDCREFRREMYELKEFVAKWFSVLLKRFDCQDRKLISLTEAICGEDIYDLIGGTENATDNIHSSPNSSSKQNNNNNNNNNITSTGVVKIETPPVGRSSNVNELKISNDNIDFKIDCVKTTLDFPNAEEFVNYDESCEIPRNLSTTNRRPLSSSSKRRKFSKPSRRCFPHIELKEPTSKSREKPIDSEEIDGESDDDQELDDDEVNGNLHVDAVPSTSTDCLDELHEGQRFDCMNDFIFSLTRYEESRGINLIVADSKKVETANKRVKPGALAWDTKFKYCYFELRCSRAGVGEQCPFRLLVINSKTERRLVITKMVDAHHQLCAQNGNDEAARARLLKRLL